MNNVNLIGRMTADPDVRYNPNTQLAVAKFRLAIDDGYGEKKRTNFVPVTVFGKSAENCEKFLKKGLQVGVQGKIQTGSYEKDGKKVYTMDVIAERIYFIEWAHNNGNELANTPGYRQQDYDAAPEGFTAVDEDIPF